MSISKSEYYIFVEENPLGQRRFGVRQAAAPGERPEPAVWYFSSRKNAKRFVAGKNRDRLASDWRRVDA